MPVAFAASLSFVSFAVPAARAAAFLVAVLALLGVLAPPASALTVAGAQYPVWKVVNGTRVALAADATVNAGERVVTGAGGKVWLQMADRAVFKVGENAEVRVDRLSVSPQPPRDAGQAPERQAAEQTQTPASLAEQAQGFIDGALSVLKGAFRYTSDSEAAGWRREIAINLSDVATIGVRGTDLWGTVKVTDAFVVLIEGVITAQSTGAEARTLDTPLQLFTVASPRIGSVSMADVQALAPETELDFGTGVMTADGQWQLHLASFDDRQQALAASQAMTRAGLATEVGSARVDGRQWHRLSVAGLASLADARALQQRVSGQLGFASPWVAPR